MGNPKDIAAWIRETTTGHMDLLTKMQWALAKQFKEDHLEQPEPDRAWCRVYNLYQQGLQFLIVEQREQAKLQLLAKRAGMATLSDEDYTTEMVALGREAVREISDAELQIELERRMAARALPDGVS